MLLPLLLLVSSSESFVQPRCTKRDLLTPDLGFSRHDHEGAALSVTGITDNEKRFGEFLFLGLVDRG
jgi:hypothetical protein